MQVRANKLPFVYVFCLLILLYNQDSNILSCNGSQTAGRPSTRAGVAIVMISRREFYSISWERKLRFLVI